MWLLMSGLQESQSEDSYKVENLTWHSLEHKSHLVGGNYQPKCSQMDLIWPLS